MFLYTHAHSQRLDRRIDHHGDGLQEMSMGTIALMLHESQAAGCVAPQAVLTRMYSHACGRATEAWHQFWVESCRFHVPQGEQIIPLRHRKQDSIRLCTKVSNLEVSVIFYHTKQSTRARLACFNPPPQPALKNSRSVGAGDFLLSRASCAQIPSKIWGGRHFPTVSKILENFLGRKHFLARPNISGTFQDDPSPNF